MANAIRRLASSIALACNTPLQLLDGGAAQNRAARMQ